MLPRQMPLSLFRRTKPSLCRAYSSSHAIREHDVVILRQRGTKEPKFHLSPPLRTDAAIKLSYGSKFNASDIIGKSYLDSIKDSGGRNVRLLEASLGQYVANSPRVATPIYPQDANLIVSFLDLNLPVPGEDPDFDAGPPVEIFEAGTGMGALTLHLARAIHGANPPLPPRLRDALCTAPYARNTLRKEVASDEAAEEEGEKEVHKAVPHALDIADSELAALYKEHLASRRAILHTLDVNPTSSRMAHGLVRHFKRGLYLSDVDFHVCTIRSYLASRLAQNGGESFLSHVILDLPASQDYAELAVKALQPDGKVVIFFPSITQILDFVVWAKDTEQPLVQDRVVELQTSTSGDDMFQDGTGGRNWDVKVVNIRKAIERGETGAAARGIVCRPKVGSRVVGGGFVAVFTKLPPTAAKLEESVDEGIAICETTSVPETEVLLEKEAPTSS
ncbi:tRNA (Adenine-N(1)-)-methyltransferase [Colletotrichum scovillei]|uniref:tRNA (adenine(58)-N(1))-methyltransferase catalytic subunit TRM61 n=1 Tax=Colletotrichum scovillei TaxID=1209932 RepID=A0A9P7RDN6_9PEZI|nr:tRNA (Adenine-N(1)-)-methyltransferase [Colletotrichum scovillei]KAF4785005.1 tRNA (Adenine-N(1)-)-methyltransferase [Colletotrichum scovillei]KAG7055590.1 tRNA (Adenine-N(1)-)-methyltransferase [Colletotrichum scovillei]KAG7075066.1 tRNA (Adenine-N(1)-)-methyltransferase [Colletotrichum scovillei]KAG7082363.1 tRNA (Adenine-N(1)-)-methyltransferase [Colletotrichum scovillei]